MDWIAPLVDYGRNKDQLFDEIRKKSECSLSDILKDQKPISVQFNTIKAFTSAIVIIGTDDQNSRRYRKDLLWLSRV